MMKNKVGKRLRSIGVSLGSYLKCRKWSLRSWHCPLYEEVNHEEIEGEYSRQREEKVQMPWVWSLLDIFKGKS